MMGTRFPKPDELFEERYEIVRRIGAGGFATVFLARQVDLGRDVALKILDPHEGAGAPDEIRKMTRRFEREARVIARFRDPHTVMLHDYGQTDDGLLYMVMEYVDGETVGGLIGREGPLEPVRVVEILEQTLESLEEAHAHGVLHRDIKPHNIMVYEHLGRADRVKVLDFGIAKIVPRDEKETIPSKLTQEDVIIGTPRYMSPEQLRGDEMGSGSDLYSLGLVAYEMITGRRAVDSDSSMQVVARHLDSRPIRLPPDADVPAGLRSVVDTMMAKERDRRFSNARDAIEALEEWYADVPWQRDDAHDHTAATSEAVPEQEPEDETVRAIPDPNAPIPEEYHGVDDDDVNYLIWGGLAMAIIGGGVLVFVIVYLTGADLGFGESIGEELSGAESSAPIEGEDNRESAGESEEATVRKAMSSAVTMTRLDVRSALYVAEAEAKSKAKTSPKRRPSARKRRPGKQGGQPRAERRSAVEPRKFRPRRTDEESDEESKTSDPENDGSKGLDMIPLDGRAK